MKCTNGVDGVSTKEDGANVCTPNEFPPKTKRLSFTADSCSQLSDMQMQRCTIEVCEHLRRKETVFRLLYKSNTVQALQNTIGTKPSHEHVHV